MSDGFDVNKWRLEHPMDYLKAIELIQQSSNKDEVFMCIYRFTRFHVPDILYKYYSLTENEKLNRKKLNTLADEKVFLSCPQNFNDPFENKAFFYRKAELNKHFKELRKYDGRFGDQITLKAASFTKAGYNSMQMWAYYSNNHSGFCVEYSMKAERNMELASGMMPIQYISNRIDITDMLVNQIDMVLNEKNRQMKEGKKKISITDLTLPYTRLYLQYIKQNDWQHEQEFRCYVGKTSIGLPFITAVPSVIYAGKKCSPLNIKGLHSIAKQLRIPFYQMTSNELDSDFQLKPKRIN